MTVTNADAAGSDQSVRDSGASGRASTGPLPDYDQQLAGFHLAFKRELQAIVNDLPLTSDDRMLDLACGDGFYTRCIDRLRAPLSQAKCGRQPPCGATNPW